MNDNANPKVPKQMATEALMGGETGPIQIEYTDLFGDITIRHISDVRINDEDECDAARLIHAYCHLRNENRTFNISRMRILGEQGSRVEAETFFESEINRIAIQRGWAYNKDLEIEARGIADKIETKKQLRLLQDKHDATERRYVKARPGSANEKQIEHMLRALGLGVHYASMKYYEFQFIPELTLFTISQKLDYAFKTYSRDQCRKLRDTHPFLSAKDEWMPLCAHHEPDEIPSEISSLKSFRKVIESDLTEKQMLKAINETVLSRQNEFEQFFDFQSDLSPADQWCVQMMRMKGVPKAEVLYRAGFSTIEQCHEAEPSQLLEVKGIGPRILEKLESLRVTKRQEG